MNMTTSHLQAGMAAVLAGNKEQAKTHLLRVLANDPRNETAWLWLSGVMPTTEQSLRCIEQLLTINPSNVQALEARDVLNVRLLVEESTVASATGAYSTSHRRYLLGEALVKAKIITQQCLEEALRRQSELAYIGKPIRLGDMLVKLKMITRDQLDAALAEQIESTAPEPTNDQATGFSDFLVKKNVVTCAQLHQALEEQQALQHTQHHARLGEVLVHCGYLDRMVMQHMLLEWHHHRIVQQDVR